MPDSDYRLRVSVFSRNDRVLLRGPVEKIGRFGIIQDYTVTLEGGQWLQLNYGVVELIAKEWIRQNPIKATEAACDAPRLPGG